MHVLPRWTTTHPLRPRCDCLVQLMFFALHWSRIYSGSLNLPAVLLELPHYRGRNKERASNTNFPIKITKQWHWNSKSAFVFCLDPQKPTTVKQMRTKLVGLLPFSWAQDFPCWQLWTQQRQWRVGWMWAVGWIWALLCLLLLALPHFMASRHHQLSSFILQASYLHMQLKKAFTSQRPWSVLFWYL